MSQINIPGLGFAQPNETLPPMGNDSAEPSNTTTNTSASDETSAVQPPEPTGNAHPAPTAEAQNDPKEVDVTMGEPQYGGASQPAEGTERHVTDNGVMEVEKEEKATTDNTPTSPAIGESRPSVIQQHVGEEAQQPEDHDSMVIRNPSEATQDDAPSAATVREVPTLDDVSPKDTTNNADQMKVDEPPNEASITDELEAALGGLGPVETPVAQAPATEAQADGQQEEQQADEHPEWETDSSPYVSSDSSSDTSSADSDDEAFNGLNLHEAARMLMDAEGGSDDESGPNQNMRAHVRTKNEMPEEVLPKPDVTITEDMKIVELGVIQHIVDNTVVIKSVTPGEYQVIDTGSVLCTASRTVIGALADVLGKVQEPLYTVRFNSTAEIKELGLEVGARVFYSASHANYVFTEALKNMKGSDASNLHDEEVGEDEVEFSDDEKEAEYKRMLKQKRREKQAEKGGRGGGGGGSKGPHPLRNEVGQEPLNYDDEDGPYKPLTRPPGFGSGGFGEASEEPPPGSHRGRGGRGGARGRGQQRGRGRGKGGGPGGREGYSLPPQGQGQCQPPQQYPPQQFQPQFQPLPQHQQPQQYQPPQQYQQQPNFNFGAPSINQMFGQVQQGAQWAQGMPFANPQNPPAWGGQQAGQAGPGAGGLLTPQVLEVLKQYQAAQMQNQGQGQNGGAQGGYQGGGYGH